MIKKVEKKRSSTSDLSAYRDKRKKKNKIVKESKKKNRRKNYF